ncbi:MAG: hypothetical protein ABSE62_15625 [Chthoniobacteraceae bacterium]|jgi:hypothetical protein
MKIKTIKRIAISLLAGTTLCNSSFAGPAAWTYRHAPAAPGLPEKKTVPRVPRPISAIPSQNVSQPAPSNQFSAGENPFSVGDEWFRD